MRILGGKKDYYDYLVSYYGFDENITYDRRPFKDVSIKWRDRFLFYICGEIVPVIKKNQNFIFDPQDHRLTNGWNSKRFGGHFERDWMEKWFQRRTKVNAEMRQPVLCSGDTFGLGPVKYFIPCLGDFGFASRIPAHKMYEKIYAFLGWLKDNPEPPNNQTDKDKIVAHGFDLKTSFRPNIKNNEC